MPSTMSGWRREDGDPEEASANYRPKSPTLPSTSNAKPHTHTPHELEIPRLTATFREPFHDRNDAPDACHGLDSVLPLPPRRVAHASHAMAPTPTRRPVVLAPKTTQKPIPTMPMAMAMAMAKVQAQRSWKGWDVEAAASSDSSANHNSCAKPMPNSRINKDRREEPRQRASPRSQNSWLRKRRNANANANEAVQGRVPMPMPSRARTPGTANTSAPRGTGMEDRPVRPLPARAQPQAQPQVRSQPQPSRETRPLSVKLRAQATPPARVQIYRSVQAPAQETSHDPRSQRTRSSDTHLNANKTRGSETRVHTEGPQVRMHVRAASPVGASRDRARTAGGGAPQGTGTGMGIGIGRGMGCQPVCTLPARASAQVQAQGQGRGQGQRTCHILAELHQPQVEPSVQVQTRARVHGTPHQRPARPPPPPPPPPQQQRRQQNLSLPAKAPATGPKNQLRVQVPHSPTFAFSFPRTVPRPAEAAAAATASTSTSGKGKGEGGGGWKGDGKAVAVPPVPARPRTPLFLPSNSSTPTTPMFPLTRAPASPEAISSC
ncbi:hypothetical protein BDN71DRAFT_1594017, partial [Pleurotus eryngii]